MMRVLWKYDGDGNCGDVHKRDNPKPGPGDKRIGHAKKTPPPSVAKPQKPQKSKNK